MSWTDDRVEILSKLWLEGRSASQIATELGLGVTRNAVIGKVHRLGLAGRPKAAPPTVNIQARIKPKLVTPRAVIEDESMAAPVVAELSAPPMPLKPALVVPRAKSDVVIPFSERVTIMELRESSCRWPMGDPMKTEFRFCGARTGGAGPYCDTHAQLAFQPAPERRRGGERYAKIA